MLLKVESCERGSARTPWLGKNCGTVTGLSPSPPPVMASNTVSHSPSENHTDKQQDRNENKKGLFNWLVKKKDPQEGRVPGVRGKREKSRV